MNVPFAKTTTTTRAALLLALAGSSCGGTTTTTAYAYDPYLSSYYYPADVSYSSYYYTDSWAYGGLYYYSESHQAATTTPTRWTVGTALRALAQGQSVCPGQVTVTPTMTSSPCSNNEAAIPSGATVVFTGCQLTGGGVVDGTVVITAMEAASDPTCPADTTITLTHKTTVTNLTYKATDGSRIVIPTQTDTGTNMFTLGQTPPSISINSTGRFQSYDASNNLQLDQNFNGTRTYKFADTQQGYTVDGTTNLQDNTSASTAKLTATALTRTVDCCYPTAGMLSLSRMGTTNDQHTWTFGPSCGSAVQDSTDVTLPACQ